MSGINKSCKDINKSYKEKNDKRKIQCSGKGHSQSDIGYRKGQCRQVSFEQRPEGDGRGNSKFKCPEVGDIHNTLRK